uniref:Conotoxin n=1 Tax=Conus andremenezi TaxID=1077466 RepID=A0A291C1Q2_9COND|nr:conotoxin [Conus andremenezi]
MQSFTCWCLLVPLLLFLYLTQRSDTADHEGAATEVRSADHIPKHDVRQALKRRYDGRYGRKQHVSRSPESIAERVREQHREEVAEKRNEKAAETKEELDELGR